METVRTIKDLCLGKNHEKLTEKWLDSYFNPSLADFEHYLYWVFDNVEIGKRGKDIFHYKGDYKGQTYYFITTNCKEWSDLKPEELSMLRLYTNDKAVKEKKDERIAYLVECSSDYLAVYYKWTRSDSNFAKITPAWKLDEQ